MGLVLDSSVLIAAEREKRPVSEAYLAVPNPKPDNLLGGHS